MNKRFIKTPLKGVTVHGAKDVGTRTVNLLMGEHGGEYVRGDIMDANAVIQAFDELKGNVDNNHDTLEELVDEIHTNATVINGAINYTHKVEDESKARDNELDAKINQVDQDAKARDAQEANERLTADQNEAMERKDEDAKLSNRINEEKQRAEAVETNIKNDLTAEVNRATAAENTLDAAIKAEAAKRESDDATIKDSVAAEVARATAKEDEIQAKVNVIDGDSTTEGSFRKAIADVVGAAPEAYDTLKEIADKLNENDDLHTAINDAIATKAKATDLTAEIERAKAAEAANTAAIEAEAARAKDVESDNAQAITAEETRATNAETALNTSVETEAQRAKDQEAYLQQLINTKADTTALEGAKTELEKKVADEFERAGNAEDELQALITSEQNRATAAETSIADDLNAKLTKEAEDRAAADTELQEKINTKVDATALATLEEKVTANTEAIDTKQPKGDYILEQDLSEYAKKDETVSFTEDQTNIPSKIVVLGKSGAATTFEGILQSENHRTYIEDGEITTTSLNVVNLKLSTTASTIETHSNSENVSVILESGDIRFRDKSMGSGYITYSRGDMNLNPYGVLKIKGTTIDYKNIVYNSTLADYVPKSEYDEKIAALEARIAALEASSNTEESNTDAEETA